MIRIKLFAMLKDRAGRDVLQLPFSEGTVSDVLRQVNASHPELTGFLASGRIMTSINHEFVKHDASVRDGDEIALLPPFSGGSGPAGRIRIQTDAFSLDQEIENLKKSSASIGGIVSFLGTTRDISRDKAVFKLEFEQYAGMAKKKLEEISEHAIREYGVIDLTIIHRVGTIPAGENILLIAVAAVHRDEAFRCCRFCIDALKRSTPIWKKETTSDGEVWVEEIPEAGT